MPGAAIEWHAGAHRPAVIALTSAGLTRHLSWPTWMILVGHTPVLAAVAAMTGMALVAGGVAVTEMVARWRHRRLSQGARWVVISTPPEVAATSAPALWVTMAGILTPAPWRRHLYGRAHVAWEYTWTGRALTIRIWVPGTIPPGAVEAAVTAAWPGATVNVELAAAPIPMDVTVEAGGALWPQQNAALPLRTSHDVDPLRALLAAGASVRPREHACVQVLARPATPAHVRAARRAATAGGPAGSQTPADAPTRAIACLARLALEPVLWVLEVFLPGRPASIRGTGSSAAPARSIVTRDPVAESQRRAVAEKAAQVPHFEVSVRYAVAATVQAKQGDTGSDPERRKQARQRLAGLAHTLASAAATYTRPNRLRRMRMAHPVAVVADRRLRRGFLSSVEELAVLAALPQDLAVPGLERARARAMPAPVSVPSGGRGVKVLGRAQIGGYAVGLQVADARQHVHLIGKTGTGKSTLLLNTILADVHAHRGVVVIDPRGDLINDILDRLPLDAAARTVIIDPDQPNPASFNPLDTSPEGGHAHLAVDNLVGIFSKIFQKHWGPRIDDTLRVSCLTLMRRPNPTLAMVPRLLNDRPHRLQFTEGLTDPEGLAGFWQWYDSMNDAARAPVIGPVLARLRAFLLRDFVKDVIGTAHSSFQMRDILDGGLLLCRLPKGILGEDTSRILGSLIVARVWQAAIARAAQPEDQRRDATLVIDECQNFLHLPGSVDDMLAEARGFRLGLVLAHQHLAQLPAETLAAVSANARTKIIFTTAPEDAKDLSRHTIPELDEHDLGHLDVHTAAARLLVDGRELPAFTLVTNPPSPPLGHAAAIRQACSAASQRARAGHGGASGQPAVDRSAAAQTGQAPRRPKTRNPRPPAPSDSDRPMRA